MSDQTKRNPRPGTEGDAEQSGGRCCTPDSSDLTAVLHRVDHALLVTRSIRGGKVRRRILLSLDAAQRAADRAESAGHPATITLVRLLPVGHVDLDELRLDRRRDDDVQLGGGVR